YNLKSKTSTKVTSGFYSDQNPTFDPEGRYLYLITNRSFSPVYSDFDNTWSYPNSTQLAAITLRADVDSPLAAKNDTVAIAKADSEEKKEDEAGADKSDKKSADKKKKDDVAEADKKEKEKKAREIDLDGFEQRLVVIPVVAGKIGGMQHATGEEAYMLLRSTGS